MPNIETATKLSVVKTGLPTEKAAAYLGVCRNTLGKWTKEGRVSCFTFANRNTYTLDELDRLIRESERPRAA